MVALLAVEACLEERGQREVEAEVMAEAEELSHIWSAPRLQPTPKNTNRYSTMPIWEVHDVFAFLYLTLLLLESKDRRRFLLLTMTRRRHLPISCTRVLSASQEFHLMKLWKLHHVACDTLTFYNTHTHVHTVWYMRLHYCLIHSPKVQVSQGLRLQSLLLQAIRSSC